MLHVKNNVGFHDQLVATQWDSAPPAQGKTPFTYSFQNFFHPFVGELIARLNQASLSGMLDPVWQDSLTTPDPTTDPTHDFFHNLYQPQNNQFVKVESFRKEMDFTQHGLYANYNWELFFHIPLTIAVHLSKTRRFAESQRWFHYIFDPTSNDKTVDPPGRFWRFLAFRRDTDPKQIDALLALLSKPPAELSPEDQQLRADILNGYQAILSKPFQPHAVARTRHLAYRYCVVMKYLDNLIAWGDDLFQQDTIESINEATQLYVLAASLLGPRPQRIPPAGIVQPKTFAQLKAKGLDEMGNALVELEGKFPFNLGTTAPGGISDESSAGPLFGIGRTLYFCIPPNEKLLGYWDTVADRLFKIRHCMNIQGVVRPLALFDPEFDPGVFVKASAAGLDLSNIVSGLSAPIGPLRCLSLIQKTLELCAEVRGLGAALLAAFEKGDAEQFALVRQRHEIQIQKMAQEARFLQWKQAQESTQSLLASRTAVLERLRYYQRLLGLPADQNAPDTLPLDRRELTEENFDEAYDALVTQYGNPLTLQQLPDMKLAGDSSPGIASGFSGNGKIYLSSNEDKELNHHLPLARDGHLAAAALETIASAFYPVPNANLNAHFWGIGASAEVGGGDKLAAAAKSVAAILQLGATWHVDQAEMTGRYASYERRADEWLLQHNLAAHELMQIGRQILTSLIAEQIAHHEYRSLQQQIANSTEVDEFLHDKFTNEDLYLWMQGEISRLYYECYRFAFDTARKAERTMKQELMRPELDAQDFVKFNYWDGGRKGLLSGEALYLDVKRMEMAYHDLNEREYELTKHASLLQVDPLALIRLRTTGRCTVQLPEALFDMDAPGHYFRRIKTVAVSIPCVTGPYASVNCTLTLLKSSIRTAPLLRDGTYAREGSDDDRFRDYIGSRQSIVTSSAQSDSGLFETNLRDERYLPFENSGVISEWQLALPADPSKGETAQFDYATISDVLLHIRYTAREGGDKLRSKAIERVNELTQAAQAPGSVRLFSVRHEFPSEWAKFRNQTPAPNQRFQLNLNLRPEHYPFWSQGRPKNLDNVVLLAQSDQAPIPAQLEVAETADPSASKDVLAKDATLGPLFSGTLSNVTLPEPIGEFNLFFDTAAIANLWIAVTYSV